MSCPAAAGCAARGAACPRPALPHGPHPVPPTPTPLPAPCRAQLSEGEPLLLSYGPLSNDFLLMDYGFLVAGNPHDRVVLRYDVDLLQVRCWGVSVLGVVRWGWECEGGGVWGVGCGVRCCATT
jgi:hypothetical protein